LPALPRTRCSGGNGTLFVNHDGSFENGYAWQYGGSVAPYYGAFGEGYDLGAGVVCCGAFWASTLPGYYFGQPADAYVWDGGAGSNPGAVLGMVPGNVFPNVPNWPTCAENDVTMGIAVTGPFTVGFWGNWPGVLCGYFCAADLNGLVVDRRFVTSEAAGPVRPPLSLPPWVC
jgi:hypothetical protein